MAEMAEILRALLSNDNATRSAAEKRFEEAKKNQGAATVAALFQVLLEQGLDEPVREQGAVLLRQCLAKAAEEESIWAQLGEAAQPDVKTKLLQLVEAEQSSKVRRKIADIVQALGNQLIDLASNERPKNIPVWPELMPFLMRVICDPSKPSGVRADSLWAVKELTGSIWQVLIASADQTLQVLKSTLSDAAEDVRANAASLFCELVDNIENKEERRPLAPLTEDLVNVLKSLADKPDPKHLNTVLQSLQSTSETADFFKDHIATSFMPVLCVIAKSHAMDDTRRLALEVIVSFAEGKPKLLAKIPGFLQQALEVAIHFIMELGDDVESWSAEDDEDADEEENFNAGKEVIDRISRIMHKIESFGHVMEILKPMITALFQAPEWKRAVAGITVMSQIAEYIDEEEVVTQMLAAVKAQLRASHVRVRYAAWGAIAQFAEDHSDAIASEGCADQFFPEFLQGLSDPCQRTMIRCMEAFQHVGEAVEREDLEPFVQPFMEVLGQKLQGPLAVQKKAITFIAVIAGQIGDGFAPYYGALMPMLKTVIQTYLHKTEERTLLGKTFECISLLAESVGSAGFRADAEQIMQAMIQAVQLPNLPSNDPVKEYMMAAAERICTTMKADFLPFVPHILPIILEKFTLAPREYTGDNAADELDEGAEVNLTLMKEGDTVKILVMSSSDMEDLQHAIEAVHRFVEELGKLYAPFVPQTAQALLPVFDFSMSEEVRDLAFETWGQLCFSAKTAGETTVLQELCHEFMKRILPKLETPAGEDVDAAALKTRADGVTVCLKKAGPNILSVEQVRGIVQLGLKVLGESFARREALKTTRKGEEEEEDEDEDEGPLRIALCEVMGALMQHHPDMMMAEGVPQLIPLVQKLIQPAVEMEDRKIAVFIACDMLEHLGVRIVPHWEQFLSILLQDVMHKSPEIRQPACYGASLAAREPAFAALAPEVAQKLSEVVTSSRGRAKKKSEKPVQACADNALTAIMEILTHHQAAVAAGEAQLWNTWVSGLPCQEDEQEGVKNHKMLLTMTQAENKFVVGEGGANFPKVLSILVDIYKTDMADDDTSAGIGKLVLKIPQSALEQQAAQLKEKQRKKLLRIHREAQTAGA